MITRQHIAHYVLKTLHLTAFFLLLNVGLTLAGTTDLQVANNTKGEPLQGSLNPQANGIRVDFPMLFLDKDGRIERKTAFYYSDHSDLSFPLRGLIYGSWQENKASGNGGRVEARSEPARLSNPGCYSGQSSMGREAVGIVRSKSDVNTDPVFQLLVEKSRFLRNIHSSKISSVYEGKYHRSDVRAYANDERIVFGVVLDQDGNGTANFAIALHEHDSVSPADTEGTAIISGTVYERDGATPITEGRVDAFTGDPCGEYYNWAGHDYINEDGSYSIEGLSPGSYYLIARPYGDFLEEWWASPSSVFECSAAQTVVVAAGESATGKDFQLDTFSTISGTIYQKDGVTPVTGGGVLAYPGDPCRDSGIGAYGAINPDGTYTVDDRVVPGKYFLLAFTEGNFLNEWWASPQSVADCAAAQSITVGASQDVPNKDFQLDPGGTISGRVYANDGSTPITSGVVRVYTEDPCGTNTRTGETDINADGTYAIEGLNTGSYYLRASGGNWVPEWWASPKSVVDCSSAQTVTATTGESVTGKDFQLDPGVAISGAVYASDGVTTALMGPVYAYTGNPCESPELVGATLILMSGEYFFSGLPAGNYYLYAEGYGWSENYVPEWWASPSSVINCENAQVISAAAGQQFENKDFQLDTPGKISGRVLKSDGVTPIANITVLASSGSPCDSLDHVSSSSTGVDGTYTITDLSPGTYYLYALSWGADASEWWAEPASVFDCNNAEPVTVAEGGAVSERNFQLDPAGTLSGTVYASDGSTPITGGWVDAFTGDPCDPYSWSHMWPGEINADGTFTIEGLGTGQYYLQANPDGNFLKEFWAGSVSAIGCGDARSVAVTAGESVVGKDFQLDSGAAISGTVYESDGTTPITDGGVTAYTGDRCGTHSLAGWAQINTDGTYIVEGLPGGEYYLLTDTDLTWVYYDEWWAAPVSVLKCGQAQGVTAVLGQKTSGKNFQLDLHDSVRPSVSTVEVMNINSSSAETGGTVISDGRSTIIAKGVCWATSPNPTILDSHTEDGARMGDFKSNITGLIAGTAYHVRAYATNGRGTGYGENRSFETAYSSTLYVSSDGNCGDKSECYSKIQDAIDAAANGSVILVKQGTYQESLSVSGGKAILIKGDYDSVAYDHWEPNTTFLETSARTTIQASVGSSLRLERIIAKIAAQ